MSIVIFSPFYFASSHSLFQSSYQKIFERTWKYGHLPSAPNQEAPSECIMIFKKKITHSFTAKASSLICESPFKYIMYPCWFWWGFLMALGCTRRRIVWSSTILTADTTGTPKTVSFFLFLLLLFTFNWTVKSYTSANGIKKYTFQKYKIKY